MAIFVLTLLTASGGALLFLSDSSTKMNAADLRAKQAYALAEAGLEHARAQLWDDNRATGFQDNLDATAGPDATFDFDWNAIQPVFGPSGGVTGFTGFNDDLPIAPVTALATGIYAGFLTNDPVEGETSPDLDGRVMLTGIGAGQDGSYEMVQAIIEVVEVLPTLPPATITLLGPNPTFAGGNSKVTDYVGTDCGGAGMPGLFMPVVGAVGSTAVTNVETGLTSNPDYESGNPQGSITDLDVFADLSNTGEPAVSSAISSSWSDCAYLQDLVDTLRLVADYACVGGSCTMPGGPMGQIIVVEGDAVLDSTESGYGTLLATGELTVSGNWSWSGLILVVGEGQYTVNGSGNGVVLGGLVMANISGSDGVYGTADDCASGTVSASSSYDENGGGNSGTIYCTTSLLAANPAHPYDIQEFIQR
jgi:hypothetical protein